MSTNPRPSIPRITIEPVSTSSSTKRSSLPYIPENVEVKAAHPGLSSLRRLWEPLSGEPICPRQMGLLAFLPSQVVVFGCLLLLFGFTFYTFTSSLTIVTNQEEAIGKLEATLNHYSGEEEATLPRLDGKQLTADLEDLKVQKSKYLALVVISLVSFPFHIFGMVAVVKRSFTLSLTYSFISSILLGLQLKPNLDLEANYLPYLSIEVALFLFASLYSLRLYIEKIRQ